MMWRLGALITPFCPRTPAQRIADIVRSQIEGELESPNMSPFMTKAALSQRWTGIVRSVEGELTSAAEKMAVHNPASALEAALWIRLGTRRGLRAAVCRAHNKIQATFANVYGCFCPCPCCCVPRDG